MEKSVLQKHVNKLLLELVGDIPSFRSSKEIERELRIARRMIEAHDEETVNEHHEEFDTLEERDIHYMEK